MKLKNDTERKIYAAAFVQSFNEKHSRGPHESPCRNEPSDRIVRVWEKWCTVTAIEDAQGIVLLHRKHQRKARGWS